MSVRSGIARWGQRLFAPADVTIISDDCWGGQYYRSLGLPYLTPTVGCWIEPARYLGFIEHLSEEGALRLQKVAVEENYPVLETKHARLHFIHDRDPRQTAEAFERRVARMNFERIFFKVDLGRGFGRSGLERWNALALPHSVALHPTGFSDGTIHHGVEVVPWVLDGAAMYYYSRRSFDLIRWLRTGAIKQSAWRQSLYTLFADPYWKDVPGEAVLLHR